jgi:lipopolysaccharide export LptBFGC system permease protein LptF
MGTGRRRDTAPKEASLDELLSTIRNKQASGGDAIAERMELQQRFSFGFVPIIFCLLGVSLTLLPRSSRASRSWGFALCLFWLVAYYVLLSLGKALGDKGVLPPVPALWLPNFLVGGIAVFLYTKAVRESPLALQTRLERAWAWVAHRAARR